MRDAAGDLRLAVEPRDQGAVRRKIAVQDLHRDGALHRSLKAEVHAAHRSDADQPLDRDLPWQLEPDELVVAFRRARTERRAVARAEERLGSVARAAYRADGARCDHGAKKNTIPPPIDVLVVNTWTP